MLLFYRQNGAGFPVLILHGLLGMSDNWVSIANKLASNFKIVVPDLRNHGQSFHAEEMNYEVMADDVIFLCKKLNINKCAVIGHSMGGKVAITIANKQPDLLDKLIVVDIGLNDNYKSGKNLNNLLNQIQNFDLEKFKERSQIAKYFEQKGFDKKMLQLLLKNIYFSENKKWEWRFNKYVIHNSLNNILTELNLRNIIFVKTLFIKGSQSNYLDNDDFNAINNWFADVQIAEIAGAGHWVHADNPEQFVKTVLDFLKR